MKQPSRYEPVRNETYADLLDHYGVEGFPARVRKAGLTHVASASA